MNLPKMLLQLENFKKKTIMFLYNTWWKCQDLNIPTDSVWLKNHTGRKDSEKLAFSVLPYETQPVMI